MFCDVQHHPSKGDSDAAFQALPSPLPPAPPATAPNVKTGHLKKRACPPPLAAHTAAILDRGWSEPLLPSPPTAGARGLTGQRQLAHWRGARAQAWGRPEVSPPSGTRLGRLACLGSEGHSFMEVQDGCCCWWSGGLACLGALGLLGVQDGCCCWSCQGQATLHALPCHTEHPAPHTVPPPTPPAAPSPLPHTPTYHTHHPHRPPRQTSPPSARKPR